MVTCKRNLGGTSLLHVNSLHAHEWGKNVTVSIIYVFEQCESRHKYEHTTHNYYVCSAWHTCTKRPTIKMTMRLFECELMYSLSVFTSRHPTIQTYFTQISNDPDHAIDTGKKLAPRQYADEHSCTYGYF